MPILIDNFHRFVIDFQKKLYFDHLAAGCQPGRWVMANFFRFTQIGDLRNTFTHGEYLGEFQDKAQSLNIKFM